MSDLMVELNAEQKQRRTSASKPGRFQVMSRIKRLCRLFYLPVTYNQCSTRLKRSWCRAMECLYRQLCPHVSFAGMPPAYGVKSLSNTKATLTFHKYQRPKEKSLKNMGALYPSTLLRAEGNYWILSKPSRRSIRAYTKDPAFGYRTAQLQHRTLVGRYYTWSWCRTDWRAPT